MIFFRNTIRCPRVVPFLTSSRNISLYSVILCTVNQIPSPNRRGSHTQSPRSLPSAHNCCTPTVPAAPPHPQGISYPQSAPSHPPHPPGPPAYPQRPPDAPAAPGSRTVHGTGRNPASRTRSSDRRHPLGIVGK